MNPLPNPIAGTWMDSEIDWAETHTKVSEAEVDRFIADRLPVPPVPAECCTELQADPDPSPFVFPLEPILTRHQWLGPVLVTCVVVIWMCVDAYLESTR